jgi:hypothetical protein
VTSDPVQLFFAQGGRPSWRRISTQRVTVKQPARPHPEALHRCRLATVC